MIKDCLKNYYKWIIGVFLLTMAQAFANLSLPTLMVSIVNNGIENSNNAYIVKYGIIMLGIAIIGLVGGILSNLVSAKFSALMIKDLRKDVYSKTLYMDRANYKSIETSSLITRSTNDIEHVQMFNSIFFKMMFFTLLMGIGGAVNAIKISEGFNSLTIVILCSISFCIALLLVVYFIVIPKFSKMQKLIDKMNNKTRDILNGILVIRSFNKEKHEEKEFDKVNKDTANNIYFINKMMSILSPFINFIIVATQLAIIYLASKQATNIGEVSKMMAFLQYSLEIIMSFIIFAMIFIMLPRANISYKRIKEVLDKNNDIANKKDAIKLNDIKGDIDFVNVDFQYNDSKNKVLENISFSTKPGMTTAIIGSTGCGKSTIVNLIPRLMDVTKGKILLDGKDLKDIDIVDLRNNISFISQKAMLFSGTIQSNILMGKKDANEKEINKAIEVSCSKEFIDDKEKGLKDPISQAGTNISGGQKQRLSIARALVKDAKIMIIDDSFSALDFKTDAKVRELLKKEYSDKNIIIVAQRVGTIMNADQIIVLDEGKIVAIGKHQELMKKCKIYKEIANSQLSGGEINA